MSCEERRNQFIAIVADVYGMDEQALADAVTALTGNRRRREGIDLDPDAQATYENIKSIASSLGQLGHSTDGEDEYIKLVAQIIQRYGPSSSILSAVNTLGISLSDPVVRGRSREDVEAMIRKFDLDTQEILNAVINLRPLPAVTWGEMLYAWENAGLTIPKNLASLANTLTLPPIDPTLTFGHYKSKVEFIVQLMQEAHEKLLVDDPGHLDALDVVKGTSFIFAGPPGTGKSTLMKIIAPFIPRMTPNGKVEYGVCVGDFDIVAGDEATRLLISTVLDNGTLAYRPGPLLQYLGAGGIAIANEPQRNGPFAATLQTAMEVMCTNNGYQRTIRNALNDAQIPIPPQAMLVLTGNPPFDKKVMAPLLDRASQLAFPKLSVEEKAEQIMLGARIPKDIDPDRFREDLIGALNLVNQMQERLKEVYPDLHIDDRTVTKVCVDVARSGGNQLNKVKAIAQMRHTLEGLFASLGVEEEVMEAILGTIDTLIANVYGAGPTGNVRLGTDDREGKGKKKQ